MGLMILFNLNQMYESYSKGTCALFFFLIWKCTNEILDTSKLIKSVYGNANVKFGLKF